MFLLTTKLFCTYLFLLLLYFSSKIYLLNTLNVIVQTLHISSQPVFFFLFSPYHHLHPSLSLLSLFIVYYIDYLLALHLFSYNLHNQLSCTYYTTYSFCHLFVFYYSNFFHLCLSSKG